MKTHTRSILKQLSRREFLGVTATVALSTDSLLRTADAEETSRSKPWYSVMRRCGQINLNERDPLTLDANAWMDYRASLEVDAVLLNGGSIVAFYPTRVPFHHGSQYLDSRDLFGDRAAAKKRGLRLVARMDCNFAYAEALRARPEYWWESKGRKCEIGAFRCTSTTPRARKVVVTHDECTAADVDQPAVRTPHRRPQARRYEYLLL